MCRRRRLAAIVVFRFVAFTIFLESLGAIGRVTETLAPRVLTIRMDGALSFIIQALVLKVCFAFTIEGTRLGFGNRKIATFVTSIGAAPWHFWQLSYERLPPA